MKKIRDALKLLEDISRHYANRRVNTSNRIFLNRRWEAAKLVILGINKKNYKQALKFVDGMMGSNEEKDAILLKALAREISKYKKKTYGH